MINKNYDYNEELNILIPLVKKVGIEILKIYETDFTHEIKADDSPVTKADLLANKLIIEGISKFDYEIISEESENAKVLTSKRTWVIDPLDGTKNFVKKNGEFAIMIGLLDNFIPVLGLVYSPVSKKLYYAISGQGSYLIENDKKTRLQVSNLCELQDMRKLIGYSTHSETDKKVAQKYGITKFISMGGIGLKLGFIAEGKGELYFFNKDVLGLWDLIGPMVILEEAGGVVFQTNGKEFDFRHLEKDFKLKNGLVATNKNCENKIKLMLKEMKYLQKIH